MPSNTQRRIRKSNKTKVAETAAVTVAVNELKELGLTVEQARQNPALWNEFIQHIQRLRLQFKNKRFGQDASGNEHDIKSIIDHYMLSKDLSWGSLQNTKFDRKQKQTRQKQSTGKTVYDLSTFEYTQTRNDNCWFAALDLLNQYHYGHNINPSDIKDTDPKYATWKDRFDDPKSSSLLYDTNELLKYDNRIKAVPEKKEYTVKDIKNMLVQHGPIMMVKNLFPTGDSRDGMGHIVVTSGATNDGKIFYEDPLSGTKEIMSIKELNDYLDVGDNSTTKGPNFIYLEGRKS